ncbi:hypothetical protein L6452_44217 [Arctium lappa]|uniref:Uncharacterized protein n=1 Tax=Arctium lappa TaxID=4217 RepID=A0ACB8XJ31_ARCLA|nr:hypothetical protein L6452_44217 [Arctium lappa]
MQPAMWTIRTVLEDFDLQYVYGNDSEDLDCIEEEMAEVGVDMKNFSSIIDWDLEWLGNKDQLVEEQKLGEDDPPEVEVDAFYNPSPDPGVGGDRWSYRGEGSGASKMKGPNSKLRDAVEGSQGRRGEEKTQSPTKGRS